MLPHDVRNTRLNSTLTVIKGTGCYNECQSYKMYSQSVKCVSCALSGDLASNGREGLMTLSKRILYVIVISLHNLTNNINVQNNKIIFYKPETFLHDFQNISSNAFAVMGDKNFRFGNFFVMFFGLFQWVFCISFFLNDRCISWSFYPAAQAHGSAFTSDISIHRSDISHLPLLLLLLLMSLIICS